MTMNCPDPSAYDDLEHLGDQDPLRLHLEECPRCRSMLKARMAFESSPELSVEEESRCRDAEQRLGVFLEDALATQPGHAHEVGASFWGDRWSRFMSWLNGDGRPLRSWSGALAASLAVMLVLFLFSADLIQLPASQDVIPTANPMRSGTQDLTPGFTSPTAQLGDDGILSLQWAPIEGADTFHVLFWSESLAEIESMTAESRTSIMVEGWPPSRLHEAAFFCVVAMKDGRELARSEMMPLP